MTTITAYLLCARLRKFIVITDSFLFAQQSRDDYVGELWLVKALVCHLKRFFFFLRSFPSSPFASKQKNLSFYSLHSFNNCNGNTTWIYIALIPLLARFFRELCSLLLNRNFVDLFVKKFFTEETITMLTVTLNVLVGLWELLYCWKMELFFLQTECLVIVNWA